MCFGEIISQCIGWGLSVLFLLFVFTRFKAQQQKIFQVKAMQNWTGTRKCSLMMNPEYTTKIKFKKKRQQLATFVASVRILMVT